jgi:hypothetical protein
MNITTDERKELLCQLCSHYMSKGEATCINCTFKPTLENNFELSINIKKLAEEGAINESGILGMVYRLNADRLDYMQGVLDLDLAVDPRAGSVLALAADGPAVGAEGETE